MSHLHKGRETEREKAHANDQGSKEASREEQLRRSERLYRAIGESINYGIWVCEPGGRNIYASDSFLKLVGLTQEECSAFGWGKVLHPDEVEATMAAWEECTRTGNFWEREHRFWGVDGHWHYIKSGEFIQFSVTDDGPGIEPAFHERIFQIFQTLQPRDMVESSGVGLAIVKKAVESQGGVARLSVSPGRLTPF